MSKETVKILVVDDEQDITISLQSFLGRRGFMVNTTPSGKDALAIIKSSKPDLVLLDLTLSEMDGRDVLRELRKHDKKTKVVVITGHMLSSDEEKEEIYSLGISEYLNKPIILEHMVELIYSVLGKKIPAKYPCLKKKIKPIVEFPDTPMIHRLSNLLGIIRNKNENFTLNIKEDIYKDKSDKEIIEMALEVMNESIDVVDRAMNFIKKTKKI